LKSSQEIETKALVKPFRFEDYLSELWSAGGFWEVFSSLDPEFY
jgi:hypothetical protein